MVDRTPSRRLKLEVAFATAPDAVTPTWVDLTARLDLAAGVSIRRGRTNEFDRVTPGTMSVVLDNTDGALTPGNTGSTYYPNVIPGRRIRLTYIDPDTSAVTAKFDGYVDEWPVQWPGGMSTYAESTVTATDLLGRFGSGRRLKSVIAETVLLDGPAVYYPMTDESGSVSSASIVPGPVYTLARRQIGAGGTLDMGTDAGPPTATASVPAFTPDSGTSGVYLAGDTPVIGGAATPCVLLEACFLTTSAVPQVIAALDDGNGNSLSLEIAAGGFVRAAQVYGGAVLAEAVSGGVWADGLWHHVAVTVGLPGYALTGTLTGSDTGAYTVSITGGAYPASLSGTLIGSDGEAYTTAVTLTAAGGAVISRGVQVTVVVDGVSSVTAYQAAQRLPLFRRISVGGSGQGSLFTGSIGHVAAFSSATSLSGLVAAHATAATTGFAGEKSDARIGRVLDWLGFPFARRQLETGKSTVGHFDPTGMDPLSVMQKLADTEDGMLYADASGNVVMRNRTHNYSITAADLTIPAMMLGQDTAPTVDMQLVTNEVTGTRASGATVVLRDQASIDACGLRATSIDTACATDNDLYDLVAWRLNRNKTPRVRFSQLTLDGFTDATYSPTIRAAVAMGAHVQVTGMPTQYGPSTTDQTVQGWTETITRDAWSYAVNTSSYGQVSTAPVLILNDATYGVTDSTNVLAY